MKIIKQLEKSNNCKLRYQQDAAYRERLVLTTHSPEANKKRRESLLRIFSTPEHRLIRSLAHKGIPKPKTPDWCEKVSNTQKERCRDLLVREQIIKNLARHEISDAVRANRSTRMKLKWLDPVFVKKLQESRIRRPNKVESYIIGICKKYHLPFEYNGNYDLGITLGGMIPDLVNVNGKKQVIEIFGESFHDPETSNLEIGYKRTEKGRIEAYKALGFTPLILWYKEIRRCSEEEIRDKISAFSNF